MSNQVICRRSFGLDVTAYYVLYTPRIIIYYSLNMLVTSFHYCVCIIPIEYANRYYKIDESNYTPRTFNAPLNRSAYRCAYNITNIQMSYYDYYYYYYCHCC